MKLFKEICQFMIVCYIACLITKLLLNKFTFDTEYLVDSLFITLGATFGWFMSNYFIEKKKKRNN